MEIHTETGSEKWGKTSGSLVSNQCCYHRWWGSEQDRHGPLLSLNRSQWSCYFYRYYYFICGFHFFYMTCNQTTVFSSVYLRQKNWKLYQMRHMLPCHRVNYFLFLSLSLHSTKGKWQIVVFRIEDFSPNTCRRSIGGNPPFMFILLVVMGLPSK